MKIPKPTIVTRDKWGAEKEKDCSVYTNNPDDLPGIYNEITIHHEAGAAAPTTMTLDQGCNRMQEIQAQHFNQGWCDIGYHYVIDGAGRIYSGRSIFQKGAHVENHNTGNLGICLMGNFEERTPTEPQVKSLVNLLAFEANYLKIPVGDISGHRDFLATACPGKNLYSLLPEIRRRVSKILEGG